MKSSQSLFFFAYQFMLNILIQHACNKSLSQTKQKIKSLIIILRELKYNVVIKAYLSKEEKKNQEKKKIKKKNIYRAEECLADAMNKQNFIVQARDKPAIKHSSNDNDQFYLYFSLFFLFMKKKLNFLFTFYVDIERLEKYFMLAARTESDFVSQIDTFFFSFFL